MITTEEYRALRPLLRVLEAYEQGETCPLLLRLWELLAPLAPLACARSCGLACLVSALHFPFGYESLTPPGFLNLLSKPNLSTEHSVSKTVLMMVESLGRNSSSVMLRQLRYLTFLRFLSRSICPLSYHR